MKTTAAPRGAGATAPGSLVAAVGAGLFAPAPVMILLAAAGFAIGVPIGPAHAVIALAAGASLSTWAARDAGVRSRAALWLVAALPLLGWAASCALASRFFDMSWDGLAYHAPAIDDLARGWNPFHVVGDPFRSEGFAFWIDHYPKASWEVAAALYRLGIPFQAAKGMNVVLIAAALCFVFAAARARAGLGPFTSLAIAAAAALNPVAVAQLFSLYVDGQLAATITILLAAMLLVGIPGLRLAAATGLAGAALYLPNLKFTGVVYAVGAALAFVAIGLLTRAPGVRRYAVALAVAIPLAVALVGYAPYVTNAREHGHPFFPIMGPGKIDFMTANTPSALRGRDRLSALAIATFGACDGAEVHPKAPFRVVEGELAWLGVVDLRVGGFGPLFSGALLVALATTLLLLWRAPETRRDPAWLVGAALVASVLVNPEAWWARYVPQLWLVPILTAVVALRARRRALAAAGLALALAGSALTLASQHRARTIGTTVLAAHLDSLARMPQPLEIYFGPFEGLEPSLRERGIAFHKRSAAPSCAEPVTHPAYPQYTVCSAGASTANAR
ncbi:hypothetical protein [Anaeromyxobacter soli]|uniref:hypothetical protein n=1 Tax=Anaeromyxobacter soli TaxID=2922725 RepID=UPI001FAEC3F4|nr:hypothetical protein [Anaeromyxobacter sp. SG29]